jgi:hypothetical protein
MRASYNRMTLSEGMAGVVYVLPGFGDKLAQAIFPAELWSKFDYSNPESFRQQGWVLLHEKEALHNDIAALKQSLTQEMLRSPLRHALASIPLAVDGLRYVFWLLPFALVALIPLVRRDESWVWGALVLTILTFVFHAAFTHFRARYGLPMLFGVAPFAAVGLTEFCSSALQKLEGVRNS